MAIKCTLLIQLSTNPSMTAGGGPHIAGWSESYYTQAGIDVAKARWQDVCAARAGLLPGSAGVVGQRYQIIGGGSSTTAVRFHGSAGTTGIPQKAALCNAEAAGFANARRFTLRGIPDAYIVEGELSPNAFFLARFNAYKLAVLNNGTFGFMGRNLAAATVRVVSVDAGAVVLQANLPLVVGDYLQLRDVRNGSGTNVSGRYQILTVTDQQHCTIRGWGSNGIVTLNGFASIYSQVFVGPITNITLNRAVSRKVGRPFEQYRGRGSRRR